MNNFAGSGHADHEMLLPKKHPCDLIRYGNERLELTWLRRMEAKEPLWHLVTWLLKSGRSSERGAWTEGGRDSANPDAEQCLKNTFKVEILRFFSLFGLSLTVYNCLYVCLHLPRAPSVHLPHFLSAILANWATYFFFLISANDHIFSWSTISQYPGTGNVYLSGALQHAGFEISLCITKWGKIWPWCVTHSIYQLLPANSMHSMVSLWFLY